MYGENVNEKGLELGAVIKMRPTTARAHIFFNCGTDFVVVVHTPDEKTVRAESKQEFSVKSNGHMVNDSM